MDYKKQYNALCNTRKVLDRQKSPECSEGYVYYDLHHILPKFAGGSDDKDNLVLLTAREHFLAHWLLAKIYGNVKSYQGLFAFMMYKQKFRQLKPWQLKIAKLAHEKYRPKFMPNNAINLGRYHSESAKQAMSQARQAKPRAEEHEAKLNKAISERNKRYDTKALLKLSYRLNKEYSIFTELYADLSAKLLLSGSLQYSRNGDCLSLPPFTVQLNCKKNEYLQLPNDYYSFSKEYAEKFAECLIAGSMDALISLVPDSAKKYLIKPEHEQLPDNFSVLYCDRIAKQLPFVLSELAQPNSRRAVIVLLDGADYIITQLEETKDLEFSCTSYISFFKEQGKLSMHVNMRSQSLHLLPLDCFNFRQLQKYIASIANIPVYKHHITFTNLHVYSRHFELAKKIAELCWPGISEFKAL